MAKCDCYYQHGMKFLCYGTKEMEECSCGGDTSKCDFYPEKRSKKTQKMANEKQISLTDKQILALKAVAYGCNKNKRLVGSSYICDIHSTKTQDISFYEALTLVYEILDKLDGAEDGK